MSEEKKIMTLSGVAVWDGNRFLGFLEVPVKEIVDGNTPPLTEKY